MGNHVHLLMKEKKETLEQIFKRIGSRYVIWFNRKYQRCGHLFQDRYKSEVVETDPYFSVVLRYIHNNPVKAGLCSSLSEYKWSSYKEYISEGKLVDRELALGVIGEANFVGFMNEQGEPNCLEYPEAIKTLTDMELVKYIEDQFGIKALLIQNEPKNSADDIFRATLCLDGVSTRQLARVTGVSVNRIWKL